MFNFDADYKVVPVKFASVEADALAVALLNLTNAEAALAAARDDVPDYTGQWEPADYYGAEQEARNRAADAFLAAVKTATA